MSVLQALILGILQGLTEFLPISSSGHLLLFENIFGLENNNIFFNVLLHFASLLAVLIVFWKDVVDLIKNPLSKKFKILIIATIPTVILALLSKVLFEEYQLFLFLGYGFLISSILLFLTSVLKKKGYRLKDVDRKTGFLIGVIQGVAVLPGISRSGSTICTGLLCGVDRESCAKFSFILSIPIILGAMVLESYEIINVGVTNINVLACVVGFIASFVVALVTIKAMLKIVKNGNWIWFSLYLFVLRVYVYMNKYVLCLL